MTKLKEANLGSDAEAQLSRFRGAVMQVSHFHGEYNADSPRTFPPTAAEWKRIRKIGYRQDARERTDALRELNDAMPDILKLFKLHKLDASVVYLFLRDANILRKRGPWEELPLEAAIDNLRLRAHGGEPHMPGDEEAWTSSPLPKAELGKCAGISRKKVLEYFAETGIKPELNGWIVRLDTLDKTLRERIKASIIIE